MDDQYHEQKNSDHYFQLMLENVFRVESNSQGLEIDRELALKLRPYLHHLFELFPYVVWIKKTNGEYVTANRAFFNLVGLNEVSDLVGRNDFDLWPQHFAERYVEDDRMYFAEALRKDIEEFYPSGNEYLCFEITKLPIFDETKKIVAYIAFGRDVTWRREMEKQLRDSEFAYRSLAENLPGAVYRISYQEPRKMEFYNDYFEEITGYEPHELSMGKYCLCESIISPKDLSKVLKKFQKSIEEIAPFNVEYRLVTKSGETRYVLEHGRPVCGSDGRIVYIDGFIIDNTVQRVTKEALDRERERSNKLDTVSTVAGGIAHDFNNMLAAMSGNAGLAMMAITAGDPARAQTYLAAIENAAIRAKEQTRQLLLFASGGKPKKQKIELDRLVRDVATTVFGGSKWRVSNAGPRPEAASADSMQIRQAINSILENAKESMESGGEIKIVFDNFDVIGSELLGLTEGRYVKVSIIDQGIGIPKPIIGKIFDPFFTTKQKGRGFGLSTAYSIIKAHGGTVTVKSKVGEGSEFSIFLPVSLEMRINGENVGASPAKDHSLRILALDDEILLCEMLEKLLVNLGYQPVTVSEGQTAIEEYRKAFERGDPYDLVILDLTIPGGIGGEEVLKQLRQINPQVRAIVSSGNPSDFVMSYFNQYGFKGRLAKPYRISELEEVVKAVSS